MYGKLASCVEGPCAVESRYQSCIPEMNPNSIAHAESLVSLFGFSQAGGELCQADCWFHGELWPPDPFGLCSLVQPYLLEKSVTELMVEVANLPFISLRLIRGQGREVKDCGSALVTWNLCTVICALIHALSLSLCPINHVPIWFCMPEEEVSETARKSLVLYMILLLLAEHICIVSLLYCNKYQGSWTHSFVFALLLCYIKCQGSWAQDSVSLALVVLMQLMIVKAWCWLQLVWFCVEQHLLLLLVSMLSLWEAMPSLLMLLFKPALDLKPRLMCAGNVLENVKVSISGQAGNVRKRRACGKAHALVNLWKKLLLIMVLAISIMPDAEAFCTGKASIAPQFKLSVNERNVPLTKDLSQGRLEAVGSQQGLLETDVVAETFSGNDVPGTSDKNLFVGECTPVNAERCNEPTGLVQAWKCICMCADCNGTPDGLVFCLVDPDRITTERDLQFSEFALRAGSSRLSGCNRVTVKSHAVGLVVFPVVVKVSLFCVSEEESTRNVNAQEGFSWMRPSCIHWLAEIGLPIVETTGQQGKTWCCVLTPDCVMSLVSIKSSAGASQDWIVTSAVVRTHSGCRLRLQGLLSSDAIEPAGCRCLSRQGRTRGCGSDSLNSECKSSRVPLRDSC